VSRGREKQPFVLAVASTAASAAIWRAPSSMRRAPGRRRIRSGASGLPAEGEAAFSDRIAYGIPDILGRCRDVYAG
jgi:hypothetical protein